MGSRNSVYRLAAMCVGVTAGSLFAEEGFQPLFDGKTLAAFHVDTPGIWSVKDGVITGTHGGLRYNDFLRTRRNYGNFILRLQFRLKDGKGNTGIQFRSKPVPDSHEVSGYQADIGEQYWGCLYDESRRKRVLAQASPESLAGLDKTGWNQYVVTANGRHITLELNGKRTVDYHEPDEGIASTGFIALQVHSGPGLTVEFKDLMIRELPATPASFAERYGPGVGEKIPAFSVPDHTGRTQTFDSLRGPKGLFLLFVRSADWCPYCKTQLAELGLHRDAVSKLGYAIAALTYDKQEALAHFAKRKGIAYPLLSDVDSKVIDAFGIRNEKATTGFVAGIPHPGIFIIGADGTVQAKYFEEDYRERMTMSAVLTGRFGERATAAASTIEKPRIRVQTSASAGSVKPGQRIRLQLEAVLADGLHVYAPGAGADFIPIAWTMSDSDAWKAGAPEWPAPERIALFGSPDPVPSYHGSIKAATEITLGLPPALAKTAINGVLEVKGAFRYQACTDRLCYPPETIPLSWKLLVESQDRERVPVELQRR